MNPHKSIALIIIIAIVITVVIIAILIWHPRENKGYRLRLQKKQPTINQQTTSTQPDFTSWKTYRKEEYGNKFIFTYPSKFILEEGDYSDYAMGSFLKSHQSGAGVWSAPVKVSVQINSDAYPGTNLQSAWVTVAYDPDIANQQDCQKLYMNGSVKEMTKNQIVNGIKWYEYDFEEVAAGKTIKSIVYHTIHNGICYEVAQHLAISNIKNYDPSLGIQPVNEYTIWTKLNSIFHSFRFVS